MNKNKQTNKKEEAISVMLVKLKHKLLQVAVAAAVVVAAMVVLIISGVVCLQYSGQKKMRQQILLEN
jgi:hypothetical protein